MIFILYSNDRGRSPSPLEDQQAAESGEEGPSKDELSSDDQPENLSNMSSHMRLHDQLLRAQQANSEQQQSQSESRERSSVLSMMERLVAPPHTNSFQSFQDFLPDYRC